MATTAPPASAGAVASSWASAITSPRADSPAGSPLLVISAVIDPDHAVGDRGRNRPIRGKQSLHGRIRHRVQVRGLHRDVGGGLGDHLAIGASDGQIDVGQVAAVIARAGDQHRGVVLLDLDLAVVGIVRVTGDEGIDLGVDLHDDIGKERIREVAGVDGRPSGWPHRAAGQRWP